MHRRRRRTKHRRKRRTVYIISLIAAAAVLAGLAGRRLLTKGESPEELLVKYMAYVEEGAYEDMYEMTAGEEAGVDKASFLSRNANIYNGVGVQDLKIENIRTEKKENKTVTVSYDSSFTSIAGEIHFQNQMEFQKTKKGYKILWEDCLIFPNLEQTDKVKVSTLPASRGEILDRSGQTLAGKGVASSVGIVPGKLQDRETAVREIAKLLDLDAETIEKKLSAKWVKDDSFVPIATLPKVEELDLMQAEPDKTVLQEQERQEQLLLIPGVMLSDTTVRSYPLGEAAAHLVGYVQKVTAEDLQEHKEEGYSSNSVIGKSGAESLYEKELKGQDGQEIRITDQNGDTKEVLASVEKQDGQNIRLTIDSKLQQELYKQFKEDRGCSAALNPYTGEVLALVSTPSYDNNDFIRGLSARQWEVLNDDENRPLYNRFRQIWCPGSTLKPVVAAAGLQTGTLDANKDYGQKGLSWQKDASWGAYEVTTLHAYEGATLKNALIYSDNIYFAEAALRIGAEPLAKSLDGLGFRQELPFDIKMSASQYSNSDNIETEIQLADSGYGQGQVLVNPLHLASIYTAFLNGGSLMKPYLRYQENAEGEVFIPQAFSEDIADEIMEGLDGVVNNPDGTGYAAHREDLLLAGKTGTAELKASKEDTSGTEIGWFCVFTAEKNAKKPVLLVSMVENVKELGGSTYVVKKDAAVLDNYFN